MPAEPAIRLCPECGSPVSALSVGGLCAKCLAAGLQAAPEDSGMEVARQTPFQEGELLGLGGMGVVHAARDDYLHREVAVKRLRPERENQLGASERFMAEAQIASQLEHPGIVPVYQAGVDAAHRPYYAMRRVKGVSLAEVLHHLAEGNEDAVGRYPLGTLLNIFQKICDAVAYAHARGVIHRDLKPENIMLGEFGEALVMDWGLAKLIQEQTSSDEGPGRPENAGADVSADAGQTLDNTVVGTLGFMAPELAEGRSRQADERSDIYALGAILYNILTLRPPIRGKDVGLMLERAKTGDIRPPTDFNRGSGELVAGKIALPHCPHYRIPGPLSAVVMKALAIDSASRFQTVLELQQDITSWQNGFVTAAEEAGWMRQTAVFARRHKGLITVLSLFVVLVGGFALKLTSALRELRATAPAHFALAQSLAESQRYDEALEKLSFAMAMKPGDPEILLTKANILQTQLRLEEAVDAYRSVLKRNHRTADVSTNLSLCEQLIAARTTDGEFPPGELFLFYQSLVSQGRSADALAVTFKLGGVQSGLEDYWRQRLAKAGLHAVIKSRSDGKLSLVMTNALLRDVEALRGMPLYDLHLDYCKELKDLSALRGMELEYLTVSSTRVADIRPLEGMPLREFNGAFTRIKDLSPLARCPLRVLDIHNSPVTDLRPVANLKLTRLSLGSTPITDFAAIKGMPLAFFSASYTRFSDLQLLSESPLTDLQIGSTPVSDLSPLADLPLSGLHLSGCTAIKTLASLQACRGLSILTLPFGAADVETLRALPNLKFINKSSATQKVPAADFWRDFDARNAPKPGTTKPK